MKTKLFLSVAIALLLNIFIAFASPAISASSKGSVPIANAHIEKGLGGGAYVSGTLGPTVGYVAPRATHVHVAAYGAHGKLLAEKIDKISSNRLTAWRLNPRPTTSFVVSFPWEPKRITKVAIVEHNGHTHPCC